MKNNKGFTLVELIVVIAMIGILAGVASYSINAVSTTRAKSFASTLGALISQCRVDTLSGSPADTYLEVSKEDDGYYATLYEGKDDDDNLIVKAREKLGPADVGCGYFEKAAPTEIITLSADDGGTAAFRLYFNRSTGAFSTDVTRIDVTSGIGGYTLTLVKSTGYHMISKTASMEPGQGDS